MADNMTPSTMENAQTGSCQGTASSVPAQQEGKATPAPTTATEPSNQSTANTATWGLAKNGAPHPWSPTEIEAWLAMIRKELDAGYHIYSNYKRIYAQKPYDTPAASEQPEAVNVEETAKESPKA